MAKKKQIGAVIGLEGEEKYRKSISSVVMETQKLDAEAKLLEATFEGQKNTLAALEARHKSLSQVLDTQNRKVTETEKALQHAREDQKRFNNEMDAAKSALEKAKQALDQMQKSGKASAEEVEKQREEVDRLTDTIKSSEKNYDTAKNRVIKWEIALAKAKTEVEKTSRELNENSRYLDEARNSSDQCATSINKFGKEVGDATETTHSFGQSLKDGLGEALATRGLELAEQAVDAVKDSMFDLSSASADLAAKTGLSEEAMQRYRDVMTEIKGDNFGESYGDVADVMAEIVQIMGELDPSAMKDTAESAMTLRDTFDMDVNESIRAVDVMMKTMGVDSQTAFDLIAKGAQNGLDRSHELTDNIAEYGQLWGQAGFSAEEMFAILDNGLDAGAYNLDKVNDYVKEFGVSLADGRIEKNIGKFSDGTKSLFEQWKNGEASTRDVFYSVIGDLSEMTNQQEALTLASEVWSALGEDNAMQVITALDDVNTAYSNVKGTMQGLQDVKYSDLESTVSQLGTSIQENFLTPIAEKALPLVTGAAQKATEIVEGIGTALTPQKSDIEQFVEDVKTANDDVNSMLEHAQETLNQTEIDTSQLEAYKQKIVEINGLENASSLQKYELQEAVQDLAGDIPELAAAWDTETGKINLSKEAIEDLIDQQIAYKEVTAATLAEQEVYNAKIAAEANQIRIDSAVEDLRKRVEEMQKLNEATEDFQRGGYGDYYTDLLDLQVALDDLTKEQKEANTAVEEANTQYDATVKYLEEKKKAEEDANKAVKENTETMEWATERAREHTIAMGMDIEATNGSADASSSAADAYENEGDAASEAAEKVKTGAETQKEAMQGVLDTYHSYVSEIEADLQNKISLFDKFDGGTDMTAEDMQKNMQTYVDGIKKYQENLAYVKEQMGEDLSPEFLKYIEDMGLDAANLLEHYATTIRQQGEEGKQIIKNTNDDYMEYLDLTGEIAEAQAANKTAMDAYTGELGSTTVEFDGLQESIDAAKESASGSWAGMAAETETALDEAVRVARESGVKIPDGLAEGIASGEISPEQAIEQLTGAIQGSFDGLAEVAKQAGLDVTPEIAAGIESGDPAQMAAALQRLISYITDNADTAALSQIFDEAAADSATAIEGHTGDVETASGNLAQAGADSAEEKQSEFKTAGDNSATTYAEALRAHQQEAAQAAGALASAAQNAIASYRNAFENAGYNLSAGVAQGISNGTNLAVNAAVNMMRQTLAAAKKEPEIASPSKKFRREVGHQIANGVAFGIRDKASLAGSEAARMSAQVYIKATAWLSKYKKSHKVSLEDEKYYWQQVAKHTQQGSDAYSKAVAKMLTASVSRTKTTGSGKNQKTVKKDAETYYSEIYSAANKYLSNQKILNDVSLQQELSYWRAVKSQLQKGTQAWYDATKQVQDLKAEITEEAQEQIKTLQGVQDSILSKYKTYYSVSAKAEMEYWDIARKQFAEGTDARIEADQTYFDAREEYYNQLSELDEDYADKKQDIDDDLEKSIKDLQDAYDDAVKSREKEIKSSMNLFEGWDAEGYNSDKLMANLKTQVEGLQFWEQQLDELAGKGVMQELMDELAEMGPDAAANLWSLNQMTAEQLDEYQRLWTEKNELAHRQALEDNKDLLKETQDSIAEARKTAQDELAKLDKDYRKAVDDLNTGLSDGLRGLVTQAKEIGEDVVSALVESIRSGTSDATGIIQQSAGVPASGGGTSAPTSSAGASSVSGSQGKSSGAADEKKRLMAIIKTGTKRSTALTKQEKEQHSTLWQRIVKSYGYSVGESQMKQIADLLGVKVSKNITEDEKKKLRAAMAAKGYAAGTRNVWRDELAWMLENARTEYVMRKSDGAILQPVHTGDKVIKPQGAENLYDFSENPTKFISTRARDALVAAQEAMQKRQDEMRSQIPELSYGGITRLNRLMESGMQQAPVVNVDNSGLVTMMQQMVSGMQAIMGQMQDLQNRQLVLDTGTLVGALQQPMSRANATVQRRRNRGTLR